MITDTKQKTGSTAPPPTPMGDTLQDPLPKDSITSAPPQSGGGSQTASPDTSGAKTVAPPNFKKVIPKDQAAQNLKDARATGDNTLVSGWIGYVLQKIKPQAGAVRSTYVSSYDTARGGFSASRDLPDVPELVVHGHYQRDLAKPREATVNSAQVKWANDEAGSAPPGQTKLPKGKEHEYLGSDHDKVALEAWEKNPKRHEMRQDAVGKKKAKEKEGPLDLDWLFPSNE